MGVAKKLYRATVAKNNNRPTLNNKKSTQRQIKGELRLPFVLSVIPETTPIPCRSEAGIGMLLSTASQMA